VHDVHPGTGGGGGAGHPVQFPFQQNWFGQPAFEYPAPDEPEQLLLKQVCGPSVDGLTEVTPLKA
jgi:hypothetical protein